MGWAKYDEDNHEIMEERWVMREKTIFAYNENVSKEPKRITANTNSPLWKPCKSIS